MLGGSFYYFRCFVSARARRSRIGRDMLRVTCDFFEARFQTRQDPDSVGVFIVVENAGLMKVRNEAIWPEVPFVYVGKNDAGHHLRVYYFGGARIE